jgi:hypothetical protein
MKPIYCNGLRECLAHFGQTLERNRDHDELHQLTSLLGNPSKESLMTVRRWLSGHNMPRGDTKLKVIYFLEKRGYLVKEVAGVEEFLKDFSRLIATNIISYSDAVHAAGYTADKDLFRVLMGGSGGTEDRRAKIKQLLENYPDEILANRPNFTVSNEEKALADTNEDAKKEAIMQSFAGGIKSLMPLMSILASSEFSDDDRARLRKIVGNQTFFDFSNGINGLSSPHALKQTVQ